MLYLFLVYVRNSHRFHSFSIRRAMIHIYSSQFSSFLFCRLLEDDHGLLQVNFKFKCCPRMMKIIFLQLLIRRPPSDSKLRAFEPQALSPRALRSCFKNQNKISFNRYISCCNRIKRPNLD